jgi:hypothetical protein
MPATNVNIFGTGATVTTGADPVLSLKYSGQSTAGWNALATGDEANPYKWLASIIANAKNYYSALSDADKATQNVIVVPSFSPVSLETRGTQVYRKYSYTIDIYELDTGSSSFDPDKVS